MKRIINLSILLLFSAMMVTSCGNGGSKSQTDGGSTDQTTEKQSATADKKLPFEHGSYVEVTVVMGMEVSKTVYFDKWGDWTATENIMEVMGFKTHKLEIVKGKTHWDINMIEKTGTRFELDFSGEQMTKAIADALAGKVTKGVEVKQLGEEKYLGYNCKKVLVKYPEMQMEMTVLTYGNLNMKMEGKMGKMDISTKITSIDQKAPSASIFEVPDGVKIEEEQLN